MLHRRCTTLHYVALKRRSFFGTDIQCRALSRQTIARGTLSNAKPAGTQVLDEGLYAAPFFGMETRHGFGAVGWVLSVSEQLLSFIMFKHTHGGRESSNRSVFQHRLHHV